jgi:hypothetical protein
VHTFDKDMHRDFDLIGSGNPLKNEVYSGEDDDTFWYCLIVKPIVQEVVEVFRSVKPKLRSTRKYE